MFTSRVHFINAGLSMLHSQNVDHIVHMQEMRNSYVVLFGYPEGKTGYSKNFIVFLLGYCALQPGCH